MNAVPVLYVISFVLSLLAGLNIGSPYQLGWFAFCAFIVATYLPQLVH